MTKTPQQDIVAGPQAVDLNTPGSHDQPLTEQTAAKLKDLCSRTKEPFDGNLNETQAQRRIAALGEVHNLR